MQPSVGAAAYPNTDRGGYECMPQYIYDARGPFDRNAAATAAIHRAVRDAGLHTPALGAGGVHNFAMAEEMVGTNVCDIVGAARQSLANPDWFCKIRLGVGDQVRLCQYTNCCETLDQKHKTVTCQHCDRTDRARAGRSDLMADGKRRSRLGGRSGRTGRMMMADGGLLPLDAETNVAERPHDHKD
jgi:hypothetical protein